MKDGKDLAKEIYTKANAIPIAYQEYILDVIKAMVFRRRVIEKVPITNIRTDKEETSR